jgi:fluoride exporter
MRLISNLFIFDPQWRTPLVIALGAVPGALCRYYLTGLCRTWFGATFPYGTFLINVSGAFVMGFFATYNTTFSTYALETSMLLQEGSLRSGFLYWMGSAILGWVALEVGSAIARRWV